MQFMYALFSRFCYVGGFGNLGDPVLPTARDVSGDVVTVCAYQHTEGRFLQSLASPRAVHNPCQRHEMTVTTNNGLVTGPVHNLLMQFFTPGSSKIEVFEFFFFDVVTTQNDHRRYVRHVLGRIYMFFTYLGIRSEGEAGGGLPRDWHTICLCSLSPWAAQNSKFSKLVFMIL